MYRRTLVFRFQSGGVSGQHGKFVLFSIIYGYGYASSLAGAVEPLGLTGKQAISRSIDGAIESLRVHEGRK